MVSRQWQISWTRESTFKHKEHLLGESSQISLQFVPLSSEISNLVRQALLVLLQMHDFFVGFVNVSLQLGVFLFQLAD